MPDDDDIKLFQDILRADPENEDVKNTIRHLHRLKDARSKSPSSPPPPCTADISRKLLTPAVRKHPDKRPSPTLPIDDEISKLIDKGVTYLDGRQAVVDGCMWGDYYARLKLGKVSARRAAAKVAADDAGQALGLVDTLLRFHASDLVFLIADPGLPSGDVGSPAQVSADIEALKTARNALERPSNLCREVSRNTGGRPARYWRLGFTYGVGIVYSSIPQGRKSRSDSGRLSKSSAFLPFVQAAYASLDWETEISFERTVQTAIDTFGLTEEGSWLRRPGDAEKKDETPPPK